jgi:integrase
MRNTFGTVCAAEGIPLRTIQQWMGHASITTTEIYASFMPRDQDAAATGPEAVTERPARGRTIGICS